MLGRESLSPSLLQNLYRIPRIPLSRLVGKSTLNPTHVDRTDADSPVESRHPWEPAWELGSLHGSLLMGPVSMVPAFDSGTLGRQVKRRGTSTPRQHAPRMSVSERCAAPRDPTDASNHVWRRSPGTRTCCWRALQARMGSLCVDSRASRARSCAAEREGGPGLSFTRLPRAPAHLCNS